MQDIEHHQITKFAVIDDIVKRFKELEPSINSFYFMLEYLRKTKDPLLDIIQPKETVQTETPVQIPENDTVTIDKTIEVPEPKPESKTKSEKNNLCDDCKKGKHCNAKEETCQCECCFENIPEEVAKTKPKGWMDRFKKKPKKPETDTVESFYLEYKEQMEKLSENDKFKFIEKNWIPIIEKGYLPVDSPDRNRISALRKIDTELRRL